MFVMSLVDGYGHVRSLGEHEDTVRTECERGWTCSERMWASECRLSCTPLQVSGCEKYDSFNLVFVPKSNFTD